MAVALAVGGVAASTLLVASACLPDLAAPPDGAPPATTSLPAVITPTCGDGVIDSIANGGATNEQCDPGDAGSIGCTSDCRISCDGGIVDGNGHCYFTGGSTTSFFDGQRRCLDSAEAHLVTYASQREADFVRGAGLVDAGPWWVGLFLLEPAGGYVSPNSVAEPGWPKTGRACPGCFASADDAGRFTDEDAGVGCLVAGADGGWAGRSCDGPVGVAVVCEREPVGQRVYFCGGPNCLDLPATFGVKRYVVPTELVTAADAPAACAPYGALVMLDSAEEREQLVRELVTRFPAPQTLWIGLRAVGGAATWDDGVADRPLPWANGEPRGDGRAYLAIADPRNTVFDTQLAHAGNDGTRRLVVCQRK